MFGIVADQHHALLWIRIRLERTAKTCWVASDEADWIFRATICRSRTGQLEQPSAHSDLPATVVSALVRPKAALRASPRIPPSQINADRRPQHSSRLFVFQPHVSTSLQPHQPMSHSEPNQPLLLFSSLPQTFFSGPLFQSSQAALLFEQPAMQHSSHALSALSAPLTPASPAAVADPANPNEQDPFADFVAFLAAATSPPTAVHPPTISPPAFEHLLAPAASAAAPSAGLNRHRRRRVRGASKKIRPQIQSSRRTIQKNCSARHRFVPECVFRSRTAARIAALAVAQSAQPDQRLRDGSLAAPQATAQVASDVNQRFVVADADLSQHSFNLISQSVPEPSQQCTVPIDDSPPCEIRGSAEQTDAETNDMYSVALFFINANHCENPSEHNLEPHEPVTSTITYVDMQQPQETQQSPQLNFLQSIVENALDVYDEPSSPCPTLAQNPKYCEKRGYKQKFKQYDQCQFAIDSESMCSAMTSQPAISAAAFGALAAAAAVAIARAVQFMPTQSTCQFMDASTTFDAFFDTCKPENQHASTNDCKSESRSSISPLRVVTALVSLAA